MRTSVVNRLIDEGANGRQILTTQSCRRPSGRQSADIDFLSHVPSENPLAVELLAVSLANPNEAHLHILTSAETESSLKHLTLFATGPLECLEISDNDNQPKRK